MKIGQKFGILTVIKRINKNSWMCKCDCGNERKFYTSDLIKYHNHSCGLCDYKLNVKHNLSFSKFYRKWNSMKVRCIYEYADNFKSYGKKGIRVCKKWNNFLNFKEDMYDDYLEHCKKFGENQTTIDRINNNLGYSKKNCRWATCKEQNRNMKSNVWITSRGKTMCLTDWANYLGMPKTTLSKRLKKISSEQALYWKKGKHFSKYKRISKKQRTLAFTPCQRAEVNIVEKIEPINIKQ